MPMMLLLPVVMLLHPAFVAGLVWSKSTSLTTGSLLYCAVLFSDDQGTLTAG